MSRYRDAAEDGYDGPSPFEERRHRMQTTDNLQCNDPDHKSCADCDDMAEMRAGL